MVTQLRAPVTLTTCPSAHVDQAAARLFLAGYLGKLRFTEAEDGHSYYSIPSESEAGQLYQIDWDVAAGTLRCSCLAGQNNVHCKHVRLFQLRQGWGIRPEAGA